MRIRYGNPNPSVCSSTYRYLVKRRDEDGYLITYEYHWAMWPWVLSWPG